ncbi:putative cystathionine gamma-synthase [Triangularia verruculosa]|uniref:Cystathionine gamma-synthase n=1 Tax=Triangularia verruculosa TaxID=2587418 RepID=A0AAN7AZZ9_9PEZI|nr:putative cystathionine gamma-synthase [Triangularia verruculosa]
MPVKLITTELGHSLPPEQPHNITFHIPGWETAKALRRGDPNLLSKLTSIYPRFGPWCEVRELSTALHKLLSLPDDYSLILFIHPDSFTTAQRYSSNTRHRKPEHLVPPSSLLFRVAEVPISTSSNPSSSPDTTIRLYITAFPAKHAPGVVGTWQNYGCGISSRLAAACLANLPSLTILPFSATGQDNVSLPKLPEPTYLPLTSAHSNLKTRIVQLAQRAALDPAKSSLLKKDDIFLYPTGMAAIWRLHNALITLRPTGQILVLGSVFHNSYHLFDESPNGMKHFGRCDAESNLFDSLEEYLSAEKRAGRKPAYCFAEFPSNPILVSVDLIRLRKLADKYDFPIVIDDTIGSSANIDVLPVADVIVTSITKSLSGYANCMGGSLLLPPHSPLYPLLSPLLTTTFRNEYFPPDCSLLLSNSHSYLPRTATLNSNALSLATYLHSHSLTPSSPIKSVLYPPFLDTKPHYTAHLRPPTPDLPQPGYGCLLALDFHSLDQAKTFYNNLPVHHGPHLGAHLTLAFPFNDAIWGVGDPSAAEYLKTFGANPEQVRISVGLEPEEELLDAFRYAIQKATEAKSHVE